MIKCHKKRGPEPKDISGQMFGRLLPTEYAGDGQWLCVCDCGTSFIAKGTDIRRGRIRSCGCLQRDSAKSGDARRTHGGSYSPEYRSWAGMIRRCTDPATISYHRYGGRGIKVCERWAHSFENFRADMGERPSGTTLDRLDNDGDYTPTNCRWATPTVQNSNTSRSFHLTANGKTQSLSAWGRELGVSSKAIRYRISIGMSHEDAVNKPFRKHKVW